VNEAEIRALCASAYLGDHWALCRVLGRYKMFVDTRDIGLSSHLMLDGYWEMWLSEELVECIRPGMTVVDVGANLGYFTLIMADRVGPEGSVHAFEPNPPIAHRMVKSLEVNGLRSRVTVHSEPLGDENDQEVILVAPSDEPKNAYVTHEGPGLALKTRRLDSFPELLDADVIKIDAEAAELDIWHGMGGLFERRNRPQTVFLEYAAARYADPAAFLREIATAGFGFAEVTFSEGIQPRTEAQILAAPPHVDQMLALRR
jgi:FkbM family methyltransferase